MKAALEACDQSVQQAFVLSSGDYSSKPQFLFNGLNKIKPEMIQEANKNARFAAEKFAADSQAHTGAIKHAVQGPFEINNVDTSSPDRKVVRVVTDGGLLSQLRNLRAGFRVSKGCTFQRATKMDRHLATARSRRVPFRHGRTASAFWTNRGELFA